MAKTLRTVILGYTQYVIATVITYALHFKEQRRQDPNAILHPDVDETSNARPRKSCAAEKELHCRSHLTKRYV